MDMNTESTGRKIFSVMGEGREGEKDFSLVYFILILECLCIIYLLRVWETIIFVVGFKIIAL